MMHVRTRKFTVRMNNKKGYNRGESLDKKIQ